MCKNCLNCKHFDTISPFFVDCSHVDGKTLMRHMIKLEDVELEEDQEAVEIDCVYWESE